MTLLDDPPIERDAKAGYSSWCRREQHQTCARAVARCTCSCHGPNGQTPPTPSKEAPPMPDTATAFQCEPCALDFPSAQGLGAHNRHHHPRSNGAPPRPVETRPRAASAPKPTGVPDRQALAVLATAYADLCGADVATSIESAGALLDAIAAAGWELTEQ